MTSATKCPQSERYAAIAETDAVVNLVGILTETANQTYRTIHAKALAA
jgi:hypothetical protein